MIALLLAFVRVQVEFDGTDGVRENLTSAAEWLLHNWGWAVGVWYLLAYFWVRRVVRVGTYDVGTPDVLVKARSLFWVFSPLFAPYLLVERGGRLAGKAFTFAFGENKE